MFEDGEIIFEGALEESFVCLFELIDYQLLFGRDLYRIIWWFPRGHGKAKFLSGRPIPTAENSPMDVTEKVSVGIAETSGEETERNLILSSVHCQLCREGELFGTSSKM